MMEEFIIGELHEFSDLNQIWVERVLVGINQNQRNGFIYESRQLGSTDNSSITVWKLCRPLTADKQIPIPFVGIWNGKHEQLP